MTDEEKRQIISERDTEALARETLRIADIQDNICQFVLGMNQIADVLAFFVVDGRRTIKECNEWVSKHPFMQYLAYRLKILCDNGPDFSYVRLRNAIEDMANLEMIDEA